MGLSRRQFTKEFKLAAISDWRGGFGGRGSAAFEVNPKVLHRCRWESSARGPAMRSRAWGSGAGKRAGSRNWRARLASRCWSSIF